MYIYPGSLDRTQPYLLKGWKNITDPRVKFPNPGWVYDKRPEPAPNQSTPPEPDRSITPAEYQAMKRLLRAMPGLVDSDRSKAREAERQPKR